MGVTQTFGLTNPQTPQLGKITATASDSWDLLWPQSTNAVTVGLVVQASASSFAPAAVRFCKSGSQAMHACLSQKITRPVCMQVGINGVPCALTVTTSGAAPPPYVAGSIGAAEEAAAPGPVVASLSQTVATSATISGAAIASSAAGGTR